MNRILDRIIPELTDELVKQDGLGESREQFLNNIKENVKKRKVEARMGAIRRQLIDKLLEKNQFDVPSVEVERKLPEIEERALTEHLWLPGW